MRRLRTSAAPLRPDHRRLVLPAHALESDWRPLATKDKIIARETKKLEALVVRFSTVVAAASFAAVVRASGLGDPRDRRRHRWRERVEEEPDYDALVLDPRRVRSTLDRIIREHALTYRQSQVLCAALCGIPRAHLSEALRMGKESVRSYVKQLLKRFRRRSMDDLVWWIRQQARGRSPRPSRQLSA